MAVREQDVPRWSGPDGTQPPEAEPVTPDPLAGLVTGVVPVAEPEPSPVSAVAPPVAVPAGPDTEVVRQVQEALGTAAYPPQAEEPPARHQPQPQYPPRRTAPARQRQPSPRLSPTAARRAARRGGRKPAGCGVLLTVLVVIVVVAALSMLVDVLGQVFH